MAKLTIDLNNASLEFNFHNQTPWCSVFFSDESRTLKLGSEDFGVLKERIISNLMEKNSKKTSEIEGKQLFTVTHLMDSHATIFGEATGEGCRLYYEATDGAFHTLTEVAEAELDLLFSELEKAADPLNY
jgi:hypothetical protein